MDPRFIVTGCWDGTIRIWCRHSGNCLTSVTPHAAPVTAVFLDTPVDQKAGLVRQHIFSASRSNSHWLSEGSKIRFRDGHVRRLGLVASQDGQGQNVRLIKEPLVEDYSLSCDNPITAMTLDKDYILTGLNNAKVHLQSALATIKR